MKSTESKENLISDEEQKHVKSHEEFLQTAKDFVLKPVEKKFLLSAEHGDCANVKRLFEEYKDKPEEFDINCVDPLNRSALVAAIENENIELIRILLNAGIKVKDSLLHAIREQYVEGVELLLQWEEKHHTAGEPYSWEAVDRTTSAFTPDITPLIQAAHMNNYEILKILLDRGATLPTPHDVRCGCDECVISSEMDSLRHSQSRINAYQALTSPSLIALSSRDPVLTAFQLSWELRRLSKMENEFSEAYLEMRERCQTFATALLDHTRTSLELEILLNHNPEGEEWEPGERHTLERLKLAIKYKQKQFVAHPNVQQLLAAIWYEGLPGFRRRNMVSQLFGVMKLGAMFPVYSTMYMFAPNSKMGHFIKKPFVKFIIHSTSYAFFLVLLGLASQRAEYLVIEWFGTPWMKEILNDWKRRERGSIPGLVEFAVILYIISLIWCEIRSLWCDGLLEYVSDLWNIVDFITNQFYLIWIFLRASSYYIVQREYKNGLDPWYPREMWDPFDPMLLSEGAFAAGMIFSYMKLVHIFSVNPHLGPLQISLGRMIIDILKFFFIYSLVLFAFGCGMNQLLWYYADLERAKCYNTPDGLANFDDQDKACTTWRRFTNMFETSQSLFWASFGLVDLLNFELTGIKSFTRFWALLMFGSYSVINIIVLLNMLIAMMSNSYQIISERSDMEWKFARSKLWMSYFEEGDTVPPPFNIIPTFKIVTSSLGCGRKKNATASIMKKSRQRAIERHDTVMHLLVRRYVTAEQSKRDAETITEDDVMEIRQDISTLRYELVHILHENGMRTPKLEQEKTAVAGKKMKELERRLMKDFQIGFVEGLAKEMSSSEGEPADIFTKIAKVIGKRTSTKKSDDWNTLVRKNSSSIDHIGSYQTASVRKSRQSTRRKIISNHSAILQSMDPEKLLVYNPQLSTMSPAARIAYAKFKLNKIKQDEMNLEENKDENKDENKMENNVKPSSEPQPHPQISFKVRPRPRSSQTKIISPSVDRIEEIVSETETPREVNDVTATADAESATVTTPIIKIEEDSKITQKESEKKIESPMKTQTESLSKESKSSEGPSKPTEKTHKVTIETPKPEPVSTPKKPPPGVWF